MTTTSTTARVIPFPQRNKGRVRRSQGVGAWGIDSMRNFGIDDRRHPKVVRIDQHELDDVSNEDLAIFLATALFVSLDDDAKRKVRIQTELATISLRGAKRTTAKALFQLISPDRGMG